MIAQAFFSEGVAAGEKWYTCFGFIVSNLAHLWCIEVHKSQLKMVSPRMRVGK